MMASLDPPMPPSVTTTGSLKAAPPPPTGSLSSGSFATAASKTTGSIPTVRPRTGEHRRVTGEHQVVKPPSPTSEFLQALLNAPTGTKAALSVIVVSIGAIVMFMTVDPPEPSSEGHTPGQAAPDIATPVKDSELAVLTRTINTKFLSEEGRDALIARATMFANAHDYPRARQDVVTLLRRKDLGDKHQQVVALRNRIEREKRK